MSYYKVGDRVRVINGVGNLQHAMCGRVGTVAVVRKIYGEEHCNVLIDGFDNPHEDDPTIIFHYIQLAPWLDDNQKTSDAALSRYLKYKTNWYKKEVTKYYSNDVTTTENSLFHYGIPCQSGRYPWVNAVFNTTRTVQTIIPEIKNIIYNDPATIVFWEDGTKTVVKCKNEKFDPEKGLAMAFSKKMLGNKGNYYNVFKKWLPDEKPNTTVPIVKKLLPDEKPGISVPIFYERRPKK